MFITKCNTLDLQKNRKQKRATNLIKLFRNIMEYDKYEIIQYKFLT